MSGHIQEVAMSKITAVDARQQFADIINRSTYAKERIVITRRGKDLVAVVPIEDLKLLEEIEDRIDLEAARKALKESGSVPWDEVKTKLGL
jgi:prevent-host-death family protein